MYTTKKENCWPMYSGNSNNNLSQTFSTRKESYIFVRPIRNRTTARDCCIHSLNCTKELQELTLHLMTSRPPIVHLTELATILGPATTTAHFHTRNAIAWRNIRHRPERGVTAGRTATGRDNPYTTIDDAASWRHQRGIAVNTW